MLGSLFNEEPIRKKATFLHPKSANFSFFGNKDYVCSTIVQPLPEIAEMCVELLLQENMPSKPPLVCLPVSYCYGGTTLEVLSRRDK